MKLTDEQRKIGIKYSIMQLLSTDIRNKRYNELQKIYESLNLRNNDKLVTKLSEERTLGALFTRSVYTDILFVIADYINDRQEIADLVDLLYAKRCPKIKKMFIDWETQYASMSAIKSVPKFKMTYTENYYLHFLFYRSDVFIEPDKVLKGFDYEEDRYMLNYSFYMTDKKTFDNAFIFCADDEEAREYLSNGGVNRVDKEFVLQSKFFDRYLAKRRCELADYLHIEENNLAEYIHNEMKSHSKNGEMPTRSGIVGQIEIFTRDIIANQNGGTSWYNAMTTTDNEKWYGESVLYVPDVDGLIRNYFKSYVAARYIELVVEKKQGFNKITLSKDCIPESYAIVYQTILCMYEMDVLYKMFALMQKQYYTDFSWEKITNQDIATRYEDIISDLEQTITDKENRIKSLMQKNSTLSLQITADNSKQTAPLVSENNKLLKVIEDKDSEIADLKRRLEYQELFISELNKPEVEEVNNTYDLELLQSKRYLFVGHISDALPDLKYKFPNSIFMESETAHISNIEVDAVVMLIKWMSHSMFYKVKATGSLTDKKIIMCNTKNIDTVLQKMYNEIL